MPPAVPEWLTAYKKDLEPGFVRYEVLGSVCYKVVSGADGINHWVKTDYTDKVGPNYTDFDNMDKYLAHYEEWELARDAKDLKEEATKKLAAKQQTTNTYYSHNSSTVYTTKRLYDDVDRKKWRKTWNWLLRFTFSPNYHKDTRYVSEYKGTRSWDSNQYQGRGRPYSGD